MLNIGINTVNFPIEDLAEYQLERAEICLGRGRSYEERLGKALKEMEYAEAQHIPYSLHLPVYIDDWYPYDYLSAYFLDPDASMRELAFRLLEDNLERLEPREAEFYVLHFGGIYEDFHRTKEFDHWLEKALDRINDLAEKYQVRILLEYFGSNKNFAHYEAWIKAIENHENLGLLLDLGHLYFASLINEFDFMEGLRVLAEAADAYHLWTTKGRDVYFKSDFYKHYHHIILRENQSRDDDWAFDSAEVMKILRATGKPMIIEASMIYEGAAYFFEGVKECVKLAKKG